ncbi:hypothetical protein IHE45_02G040300 [Dioscorea alata]|uniref:Uncharacterized protein n=1 Tax=Dioscorea alata TaxID=55571 RepID=A0ACB7WQ81_DIOAL|nr:hypothetical protein IHE45_02G040300 [Dioscorea alata]
MKFTAPIFWSQNVHEHLPTQGTWPEKGDFSRMSMKSLSPHHLSPLSADWTVVLSVLKQVIWQFWEMLLA